MSHGSAISHRSFLLLISLVAGGAALGCADPPDPEADPVITALAATEAYGDPVIANTFRQGARSLWTVSSCAGGDSVVVWSDSQGIGLSARRYSAAGLPSQRSPQSLDPLASPVGGPGCFAIARGAPDGAGNGVYVSIYDRAGNVVVPEFRVNEITVNDQDNPRVAINPDGEFVVVWQDLTAKTISAKLFRANGVAVAPAQTVYSSTVTVIDPHVAINNQGDFVVAWDVMPAAGNYDVYARRFSSSGFPLTAASIVNTTTTGIQLAPAVGITAGGDFWVFWESITGGGAPFQVFGRHFNAAGTALTGEIQINTTSPAGEPVPIVGMAANGTFLAAWNDYTLPGGLPQILARRYNAAGTPLTDPFAVSNSAQPSNFPAITADADGNMVIAWNQAGMTTADTDIAVRRYPPSGITVQTIDDGATVSGLSGAAGSWQYFKLTVPPGRSLVDVLIAGNVGDADLYVRYGAVPSLTAWDGRPFLDGSNEGAEMSGFPPGDFYIGINGLTAYASLNLQVSSQ
jgi:hypothetical protein